MTETISTLGNMIRWVKFSTIQTVVVYIRSGLSRVFISIVRSGTGVSPVSEYFVSLDGPWEVSTKVAYENRPLIFEISGVVNLDRDFLLFDSFFSKGQFSSYVRFRLRPLKFRVCHWPFTIFNGTCTSM